MLFAWSLQVGAWQADLARPASLGNIVRGDLAGDRCCGGGVQLPVFRFWFGAPFWIGLGEVFLNLAG